MSQDRIAANLARHKTQCSICNHPQREDIEADFVNWKSPSAMVAEYSISKTPLQRHVTAFDLRNKRRRNARLVLENLIERGLDAKEVPPNVVVAAVQALSKINAAGQWVERTESVNLNSLFDRMTNAELEKYACDGELPAWFNAVPVDGEPVGAEGVDNV